MLIDFRLQAFSTVNILVKVIKILHSNLPLLCCFTHLHFEFTGLGGELVDICR